MGKSKDNFIPVNYQYAIDKTLLFEYGVKSNLIKPVLAILATFGVQFAIYKQIKQTVTVGSGKGKDIMAMSISLKRQIEDVNFRQRQH